MNINAKREAPQGIPAIDHLMNSGPEEGSLNKELFKSKNNTIPLQSLSKKLYTPNTKAPFFPFCPITSEIKEIPVFKTTAKPMPSKTQIKYIKFFKFSLISYFFN